MLIINSYSVETTASIKIKPDAHILIVRRDNIGDLVCTTPILRILRESFPKAKIGVLVNAYNAGVLEGNPDVDDVFIYEKVKHVRGGFQKLKAFSRQLLLKHRLRRWRPDIAILAKAVYDRHGLKYARSMKIPCVIGYRGQEYPSQPDIALNAPEFGAQHEIEFLLQLLKPLGLDAAPEALRLFPNPDLVPKALSSIPSATIKIAVHVSARDSERQWGRNNWVALIKLLLNANQDLRIVLFWTPGQSDNPYISGEDALASEIVSRVDHSGLVGLPVKSVQELIAALSACDGFLGADGGAMHIATALGKPSVVLFEKIPEKWRHWAPWQAEAQVIKTDTDRIDSIPLEVVASSMQQLVERIRQTREAT